MDILKKHICSYCEKEIMGKENYADHIINVHKTEFDTFINTLAYSKPIYDKLLYADMQKKKKVLIKLLTVYERSL